MRKVRAIVPLNDPDFNLESGMVHYVGPGIIGSHTLCGHTDRPDWDFEETNKRVNCPGCIGTRDYVMGRCL
jgi:hypothetical protein